MTFNWWLLALYFAKGGDFVTTEVGLAQPGIYEMNPLARERWARVAMMAAAPVAVEWGAQRLKRRHPRWAVVLRVAALSAWSYAAIHNLNQYNAARGR